MSIIHVYRLCVFCSFVNLLTHTHTHTHTQSDVYSPDGKCSSWKEWSEIAGVTSDLGSYIFNYVIYVFIALIFAGVAGLYVTALAPYASGSGIPEASHVFLYTHTFV